MLSFFLFALLPILLYHVVKYLSEIYYSTRIRRSTSSEEANNYRNKIKMLRMTVFSLYWVSFVIIIILIAGNALLSLPSNTNHAVTHDILSGIVGMGYMLYDCFLGENKLLDVEEEYGNIDVFSKDEVINYRFSFYLRAFETDSTVYLTEKELIKRQQKKFSRFSEYEFCSAFQNNGLDLYAIGNPKETDAPQGAHRIYVDHDKWQEDVKELIDKCQILFILMSPRESCIWEIKQTPPYLDKTVFIIDNLQTYGECLKMVEHLSFPQIDTDGYHAIYKKDDEWQILEFENSVEGYEDLALRLKSNELYGQD